MSALVQSKLLTVIESRTIYPLGGTTPAEVDLRIVSATNHDIRACVAEKRFREDLFYRLGEFMITIPPAESGLKISRISPAGSYLMHQGSSINRSGRFLKKRWIS